MKRGELLDTLRRVEPALSSKELVPALSHLRFDGVNVTAYDDIIAIETPCSFDLIGGIRGRTLIDFLAASKAKEVEITIEGMAGELLAGRSKLAVPLIGLGDFTFVMPDLEKAVSVPLHQQFILGVEQCMISMGLDPSQPWMLGQTLVFNSGHITIFSSDGLTASRVSMLAQVPDDIVGLDLIIPPKFCSMLVELSKKDQAVELALSPDWVVARFASGLKLFSKTVAGVDSSKYNELYSGIYADLPKEQFAMIPQGFENCISRAMVVLDAVQDKFMELTFGKGEVHFDAKSHLGAAHDKLRLDNAILDGKSAKVSAPFLIRPIKLAERFALVPNRCMVFESEDFSHLVTVVITGA